MCENTFESTWNFKNLYENLFSPSLSLYRYSFGNLHLTWTLELMVQWLMKRMERPWRRLDKVGLDDEQMRGRVKPLTGIRRTCLIDIKLKWH